MRVLFIHPEWSSVYGRYRDAARLGNLYPPLGLCYIASYLIHHDKDIKVKIIDAEIEQMSNHALLEEIKLFEPELVGITATTPIFYQAKALAEYVKKIANIPVVLGGAHATVLPREVLQSASAIDYCIVGEGELSSLALIKAIKKQIPIEEVPGLYYRTKSGDIIFTKDNNLIENLDSIPHPARYLLKINQYLWSVPKKGIVPFTTIMTTRGCPFHCTFCSAHNVFGRTIRKRSIEDVVEEIGILYNQHNITHFSFIDDTFTLFPERIDVMCKMIKERNLKITFEGFTRANAVSYELLKTMKEAGLVRISFGIESGNPEILKKIKKGITIDQIKNAFKLAKKVGLETKGSAIIGLPYETINTVMETIHLCKSIKECDQLYLNICTPYPGTELSRMVLKGEGGTRLLSNDFSEYKRYGNPVIEVNNLTPNMLIHLQKYGLRKFYITPSRIFYNIRRAGIKAAIKNSLAFIKNVILK